MSKNFHFKNFRFIGILDISIVVTRIVVNQNKTKCFWLQEYNTDTTVRFVVSLLPGKLSEIEAEGIHKVFKLQTTISMTCMNAFDYNCCLKK